MKAARLLSRRVPEKALFRDGGAAASLERRPTAAGSLPEVLDAAVMNGIERGVSASGELESPCDARSAPVHIHEEFSSQTLLCAVKFSATKDLDQTAAQPLGTGMTVSVLGTCDRRQHRSGADVQWGNFFIRATESIAHSAQMLRAA